MTSIIKIKRRPIRKKVKYLDENNNEQKEDMAMGKKNPSNNFSRQESPGITE